MKTSDWKMIIRSTISEYSRHKPFQHGAALSYYTLIAIVPLLYLSISFFGMIVGHETMSNIIASILRNQIGLNDIDGIMSFLDQVDLGSGSPVMQFFGIIALIFSCTAILNSLKGSINAFYGLDLTNAVPKKRIVRHLFSRLSSIVFITAITIFVIALYFAETVFLSLGVALLEDFKFLGWILTVVSIYGLPLVMNCVIFSLVFKFLNDSDVHWKIAVKGGVFTGFLLFLGQFLIKYYLSNYFFASSGGVAGSFLV
ncbi:YihY/virulence factor BrkB family protein, partial [Crocinitomicaceae bacterium]|nr:YihY/virulence factor BrkB family protein [Crocinitomicaceae bacterium]